MADAVEIQKSNLERVCSLACAASGTEIFRVSIRCEGQQAEDAKEAMVLFASSYPRLLLALEFSE